MQQQQQEQLRGHHLILKELSKGLLIQVRLPNQTSFLSYKIAN